MRLHGHKAKRFGKGNKGLADTKGQKTVAREARHSRIRLGQGQRELCSFLLVITALQSDTFYQPRVIMVKK